MEDLSIYYVGNGKNKTEIKTVSHITHIDSAVQIIRANKIRKHLVGSESKSRLTDKLEVVWLSPNEWYQGYRYGCIRFSFDLYKIIKGKKVYFVEVAKYDIPAIRLLITDQYLTNDILTEIYIDDNSNTFLMYDTLQDKYYWNGDYTLEIILDEDLEITESVCIDFVKHSQEFCGLTKNITKCNEKIKKNVALRFVAKLIHDEIPLLGFNFVKDKQSLLVNCISDFFKILKEKIKNNGLLDKENDASKDIMECVLWKYYNKEEKSCFKLVNLYKNTEIFFELFKDKLLQCFSVRNIENYRFDIYPIYYNFIETGFVYIYANCYINKSTVINNDLLSISQCDTLDSDIYDNCGDANCILILQESNKERREQIIDEIMNSRKYKNLVRI